MSDYLTQLQRQRDDLQRELADLQRRYDDEHATAVTRAQETDRDRTERDSFAAGAPLICSDERHAAKVRGLEECLVAGQKAITHWEGAYVREVKAHGTTGRDLVAAEARIAAVRALTTEIRRVRSEFDPTLDDLDQIEAALDGANSQSAPNSSQIRSCPDPVECGHEADANRVTRELAATNELLATAREEAVQRTVERDNARASHQLQQANTERFHGQIAAVREFADRDQAGLCCAHAQGELRRLLAAPINTPQEQQA